MGSHITILNHRLEQTSVSKACSSGSAIAWHSQIQRSACVLDEIRLCETCNNNYVIHRFIPATFSITVANFTILNCNNYKALEECFETSKRHLQPIIWKYPFIWYTCIWFHIVQTSSHSATTLTCNENIIGANIHDDVLMEATQCIHGSVFTLPYRHTLLQPVSIVVM